MNTQEIKITNAQTISINAKLQDKFVTPSLEKQDVLPDENYNGLSKVVVEAISLENKTVYPNKDTQIIIPTKSLGLSSVTIEPVSLEEKTIIPSKEVQSLNPGDNFVGFSKVLVEAIPEEYIIPNGNLDIKNNGNYDVKNSATVNVSVQPNLQDKEARVTAPTNIFVHPDEDYDGLAFVNVIATVDTEQVEVTPTKEEQTLTPSEKTYFDSVTVNAIPDEYIVPSGEMGITENGNYDVTEKESVNVDIKPNLGTKTITENGTYNASDDNLDGYSSVEVETSGVDINEYFNNKPENISNNSAWVLNSYFKKMPDLIIPDNCTSLESLFYSNVANTGGGLLSCVIPKVICNNNVINMSEMYRNCALADIDISGLNTENVIQMQNMFSGCFMRVTSFNASNLVKGKVQYLNSMFSACQKLKTLNMTGWNTSSVTKMTEMFSGCVELEEVIGINDLDTSKVANIQGLFYACSKITSLDLSNWKTSLVTNLYQVFRSCSALTDLNISGWDLGSVTYVSYFIDGATKLTNLQFGYDLGKGYTYKSNNHSLYKLDLSKMTLLTHDSLMSVINNLYDLNLTYDVANGGTLYTQQLVLGATNLAKLTDEEKAIAEAKGWVLS